MTGNLHDLIPLAGGEWLVSFTTQTDPRTLFDTLKGKDVDIDIKKHSEGRSRDANAKCWALCSDIGRAMNPPESKDEIYRKAIRAVGIYTEVILYLWDVKTVKRRWQSHGVGWFVDIVDDAGTGRKQVRLYYGSSTYTVDEMRKLIDWLIDQCEQMEIPVRMSKKEEEELLERWGNR